ncbi:hypothetical protein [Salinivibrio proteolyticus]|uniref:Nitrate/nitrite sensing protein domain-containing protein n=1 Tax=Salinivibrio proteolyticus TaxID=334715 RepID=A0ABY7LHN1_9GAMM|nr:hypothetical protein [Salinivibrio proteolyticus]WBA15697.1 hypothetical protein N7E60_05345 [Salinivibrio proteolyticus]
MEWLLMVGTLALSIAVVVAVQLFRQRPDLHLHQLHELRVLLQHAQHLATQPSISSDDYQVLLSQTRHLHQLAPQAQKPMYRLFFHHLHALPSYDNDTQTRMKNRALQHIVYLVDEAVPPALIAQRDDTRLESYQQIWYTILELLQARQRYSHAAYQEQQSARNAQQSLTLHQQILAKRLRQLQALSLADDIQKEITQVLNQLAQSEQLPFEHKVALSQRVNRIMLHVLDSFIARVLTRYPCQHDDALSPIAPFPQSGSGQ